MSFCEHCEGQRFDRARVLRILREAQRDARHKRDARSERQTEAALATVIDAIRKLDVPHLERFDEVSDGEVVH